MVNLLTLPNAFLSDICTMRLDFETFTTAGPTATDDSSAASGQDSFTVAASPSGYTAPKIAGMNAGQHSNKKLFFQS